MLFDAENLLLLAAKESGLEDLVVAHSIMITVNLLPR